MKKSISDLISEKTHGINFQTSKFVYEDWTSGVAYEDHVPETDPNCIGWKNPGENEKPTKPVDIKGQANFIIENNIPSIFSYFLDGSRHVYKIADISYQKNIYPVIAGQIGVACCKRTKKNMEAECLRQENTIVVPSIAFDDTPSFRDQQKNELFCAINDNLKTLPFSFIIGDILEYRWDLERDKLENAAIAKVNELMQENEKQLVFDLAKSGKLSQENYLIKDGSLEYSKRNNKINLSDRKIRNDYRWVIGLSKSFNPSLLQNKAGKSNANIIANLKLGERTPVAKYIFERGNITLAMWYLRIRDKNYTDDVYDGVVKLEKVMLDPDPVALEDTENINLISAHVFNERNPVCYGSDSRWANHIYPIFITEKYAKSKYMSDYFFMNAF